MSNKIGFTWQSVPSLLLIVAAWQFLGVLGLLGNLPAPAAVVAAGVAQWSNGNLGGDVVASLRRALLGLTAGSFLGFCIGVATGRARIVSLVVEPPLHVLRALPAVAMVPIFIQLWGIGELSKFLIISTGVFFPVWLNTHQGARLVPGDFLELAKNLEITRLMKLRKVLIPATLPHTISGIRLGIAYAYIMLFISEWVGATVGVGYRLSIAHTVDRLDLLVFELFLLGVLAFLTDIVFDTATQLRYPWLEYTNA